MDIDIMIPQPVREIYKKSEVMNHLISDLLNLGKSKLMKSREYIY